MLNLIKLKKVAVWELLCYFYWINDIILCSLAGVVFLPFHRENSHRFCIWFLVQILRKKFLFVVQSDFSEDSNLIYFMCPQRVFSSNPFLSTPFLCNPEFVVFTTFLAFFVGLRCFEIFSAFSSFFLNMCAARIGVKFETCNSCGLDLAKISGKTRYLCCFLCLFFNSDPGSWWQIVIFSAVFCFLWRKYVEKLCIYNC